MISFRDWIQLGKQGWRKMRGLTPAFLCFLGAAGLAIGADPPPFTEVDSLINQAQLAQLKGDMASALSLASKGIELEPTNAQCFYVRGRLYASTREPAKAIGDFSRALELEPRGAEIYQLRGMEWFKLAQFEQAIADFDRFLKFVPKQEPYHWHRGIAYFFAGRFADAQKQFEMRQAAGTNTIENALWHFLSVMRISGLDKARASMFSAPTESMLIMRKIQDCFIGKINPGELMASAQANYSSTAQLKLQMFFANLYLGLYFEAAGDEKQALTHITEAAGQYKLDNFMGEAAAIKARLLAQKLVKH